MARNKQIVTIFGGTGDLTYRKLLPAFFNLKVTHKLPKDFEIVIIGRRTYTTQEYKELVKPWILEFSRVHKDSLELEDFLDHIQYFEMTFTDEEGYYRLKEYYDSKSEQVNHLFYFAVAPSFFVEIATHLETAGLNKNADIIIEKPFGNDLQSAININTKLVDIFGDDHIYRIDHYVAKEMVQNIFTVRFANALFKNNWDNKSIKSIQISALETVGVENRGNYYDHTGAIKDMIQNHLLQILSIVTMEEPTSSNICTQQADILKNLVINDYTRDVVVGQYIQNEDSLSYLEENLVQENSTTETFAALKLGINTPTWSGVPIYIRTGKRMKKRTTEVVIEYKPIDGKESNVLIIKIQPDEGVYLKFNIKKPGVDNTTESVFMDFCQSCVIEYRQNTPEAYERLLLACLQGDSSLFSSFEVVRLSWAFVEELSKKIPSPVNYLAYTDGPKESFDLLVRDGNTWIQESVLGENQ